MNKRIIQVTIGLVLVIGGAMLSMIGFHHLDSGHNWRYISETFNITICDVNTQGVCMMPEDMIIGGIIQMVFAPFLIAAGSLWIYGD